MTVHVRPIPGLVWETDFDPNTAGGVPAPPAAFAVNVAGRSVWYHVGEDPTSWVCVGVGAPAGSQVFERVVTEGDADRSELDVVLPVSVADARYGVHVTLQGADRIVAFDVEDRTPTRFRLVATDDLRVGDVVLLTVAPLGAGVAP